jgi:DNA-binding transcriptional LysR family regulator
MFTLDQLRGFVTVADELHFGRAASRLQMTQPPLSRQVQKLERAVGAQLLERDTRKVTLTPAGVAFLAEARRLLGLADGASEQARRIQAGSSGTVRLGFTATSTFGVLTRLLDLVGTDYPDIHLDLREMVSREQVAALLAGELDVGLARPPFDPTVFQSRLLHREALVVAAPTDHRLTRLRRELSADDLAGDPMIAYAPIEARYFYDLVARLVPVDPKSVAYSVSQIVTMLWLVAGDRGLAIVPASAARLRIDGVAFLPLAGIAAEPVELHLVWPRDTRNAAVRSIATSIHPAEFAPPVDR